MKKRRKECRVSPLNVKRVIISGGGTGGHVYPAISIANSLKYLHNETDILFVGAKGRIEMEKVPLAGYKIIGLDIRGLQRSLTLDNLLFPVRLIRSLWRSYSILKEFKPHVAVGVGGYASGPLLFVASLLRIPCLIQEQNSYPGITNKLLARRAAKICVAYPDMERFFPADKVLVTGNPVRGDILDISQKRHEGLGYYKLADGKKTILVTGGSGGARTLNESILAGLDKLDQRNIQVLWQTGKFYYPQMLERSQGKAGENIKVLEFINRMDLAYAVADVIISRAGAGTISELCIVGKPVILVPSPNVAADHQKKNAMSLVSRNAALMVADAEAPAQLVDKAIALLDDTEEQRKLSEQIEKLAVKDASVQIANEVLKLIKN